MLAAPRVGLGDNFFDLGGSSLLCFQFVDRVARDRGVRVSPRVVLLGTLEQVAAELDGAAAGGPAPAGPAAEGPAAGTTAPSDAGNPLPAGGLLGRLRTLLGAG
jgi:hypothetical protein